MRRFRFARIAAFTTFGGSVALRCQGEEIGRVGLERKPLFPELHRQRIELLRSGERASDVAPQLPFANYRRVAQIEIANVPEYVLSWEPQIMAGNSDLPGMKPKPIDSDLWNINDWKFAP
jgi:hypothetical protein